MRVLMIILVSIFILTAAFAVPIAYQGKLTSITGVGIDDTVDIALSVYDAPTFGTIIDADTIHNVPVYRGLFSALFDLDIPVPYLTSNLYFEIAVDNGGGFSIVHPRERINTEFRAMYADNSGNAFNANNANHALFADSADAVTWDMLSNYFMSINDTVFHEIVVSDSLAYVTFASDTMIKIYSTDSAGQSGFFVEQYGSSPFTWLFGIYDTVGFRFGLGTDTLINLVPIEIPDGYAILYNGDTAATVIAKNDSVGILLSFNSDTIFYLNYDSLLVDLMGTNDIWGALSDTFASYSDSLINVISADLDTFSAEMFDSLDAYQSRFSDSLNAFRGELSDTLSSRFIGGAGIIPSGAASVVINETSVTSLSIIMVTLDCSGGTNPGFTVPLAVTNITDGVSFTVGTADGSNVPVNLSFNYIIFKP